MDRVDQPAARDRQPEAVAQQRGDLAVGQPVALVEQHRERDGLGPELHGGGAERVGGLQRMAALHATTALRALPDVHVEATDEGPLHRQLFLVLRGDAAAAHRPVTVGAAGRQRRRIGFVHVPRRGPMGAPAIRRTGFAAGPARVRHARAARERGGLPVHGAARGLELLFQFLVLAAQPLPLRFRPAQVLAQALRCLVACSSMICCGSRGGTGPSRCGTPQLCQIHDQSTSGKVRVSTH